MRHCLVLPLLVTTLACGSSRLSQREAEADIRKDYPVVVAVKVPETASAIKGSPEHAKLVALQEQLAKTGWFAIDRAAQGDRETFAFKPAAGAPGSLKPAAGGFQVPAAEAEFVRATHMAATREGAKVTYTIRLVRPTASFGVFQALHPGVRVGETKDRHALYRREGRNWILQETDEAFMKAQ